MNPSTVKLIGLTTPIIDGIKTAQDLIVYCARVSNQENQKKLETSQKLLEYCFKNKHFSIFDQVNLNFEVTTPRDIGRQVLRHSSLKFQEFSQRYQDVTKIGFTTERELRTQDKKSKQNSFAINDEKQQQEWLSFLTKHVQKISEIYEDQLSKETAKEVARIILPEGLTLSRMYINGTLRSFIHFVQVRHHPHAQKETRLIADEILTHLKQQFPLLEDMLDKMVKYNYLHGGKKVLADMGKWNWIFFIEKYFKV